MTDAVEEIRQRAAAATPGPWTWRGNMDNEDPRLVGRNRVDPESGKRKFPGMVEVLWSYPRERTSTDRGARDYGAYLDENYQLTPEEIAERVEDEWRLDRWGEPVRETRMCFTSPDCYAQDARELAVYEVARDATSRDDPKVYRADIVDVRHPDAQFIAHARQDVETLLAEVDQLTDRLERMQRYVSNLWHADKGGLVSRRTVQRELDEILGGTS
jgi:hypothetical protein